MKIAEKRKAGEMLDSDGVQLKIISLTAQIDAMNTRFEALEEKFLRYEKEINRLKNDN